MRASRIFPVLAAALALPAGAAAQFARHTYDIRHYDLEIRPDFATGDLSVDARVEIRNAQHEKAFRFGLSARFATVSASVGGSDVAVRRAGGTVEIDAPPEGRDVIVRFRLRGHGLRSDDEERPVVDAASLFLLWSDRFYPIDFADWASVTTSVLLPPGMDAIAPGRRRSTKATADGVWHVFESSHPAVQFSVFADRRWIRTERRVGALTMVTLLHPESQRFADALFRTSGDVVAYYTALHGYYPSDQFAFVTLTGMYARRAFSGFIGYEPAYLAQTMARDGYDGHETALLWWGYATHGEGAGAFQWTEGFGDYAELLYAEARGKPTPWNLGRAREMFLALPASAAVALADLKGSTAQPLIHGRLPWVMDAVRREIGDRAFRSAVRDLFRDYRFRTFTLEQLIATFEHAARPEAREALRRLFR